MPDSASRPGVLDIDPQFVEDISVLVDAGQRGMVLNLAADLHPADLALLMGRLPDEQAHIMFAWLPDAQASDILIELTDSQRRQLFREIPPERLRHLVDALDTDDAADVLSDMSDAQALHVLPDLERHARRSCAVGVRRRERGRHYGARVCGRPPVVVAGARY